MINTLKTTAAKEMQADHAQFEINQLPSGDSHTRIDSRIHSTFQQSPYQFLESPKTGQIHHAKSDADGILRIMKTDVPQSCATAV